MNPSPSIQINTRYVFIVFLAVTGSWLLHEFAHWICGRCLGYAMVMTMNTTYPVAGNFHSNADGQLVNAAGPLITILEAIVFYWIAAGKKHLWAYPFLFTCFYMRLLAFALSFIHPNDEARISSWLGWGWATLPFIITFFLFLLLLSSSRRLGLSWRFNAGNLLLVMAFSSLIILADQWLHLKILS